MSVAPAKALVMSLRIWAVVRSVRTVQVNLLERLVSMPFISVVFWMLAGSRNGEALRWTVADGAVTAEKLADGAVGAGKLAEGLLDGKADLQGGKVRASQLSLERVSVTASRELLLSDEGKLLSCASDSAISLTVPKNSDAAFPIGTEITVFRAGLGGVTIAAAEGVTICAPAAARAIGTRYSAVRLKKWDANVWTLEGEGLAPAGYLDNFSAGFAPAGAIRLTQGVHVFASEAQLPSPGVAGRIFLVAAE